MTSLWKSMTKRKHGRCTKAISAGDSQAHCQGPYAEEPQQERRHSHIFGLHALHERVNARGLNHVKEKRGDHHIREKHPKSHRGNFTEV
ncbi:hypothetical protein DIZ76_010308 [Coccidioides immitis]|nr:hypothetical protein DIZ76_010308 [Coccidioides immitis]